MDLQTSLAQTALFAGLSSETYAALARIARPIRFEEGDAVYREAVSSLFRDGPGGAYRDGAADARILIREKTVLEDLENAIDACDSIADTLANLAVKHG